MADPVPWRGKNAFDSIAFGFENLGRSFFDLANKIQGVPLLGNWLSPGFRAVSGLMFIEGRGAREFADLYGQLLRIIERGFGINDLDALLQLLYPPWRQFRTQTDSWLRDHLARILRGANEFLADPARWVLNRVRDFSPQAYEILRDFTQAYLNWLQRHFPLLYTLYRDPRSFITRLVEMISYDVASLLRDPVYWLKDNIARWLGIPYAFWSDPWRIFTEMILTWLERNFDRISTRVSRFVESALRFVWEGRF